ncbi:hypothetical protein [Haloquadratum walsbyi]|jgi:Uncharacterized conserved protein (DUF2088).|uniref:Uncharacterized conserved protein (DUF2088) n=1 Tax=Haloquadratum walsbyi J07HQW2 TaxID=1238425 RepID=U1NJD7_9EURY|nr:hypothetical protein [Haloquadratum walsbyi]ERG97048.1 MAG: uncharacterized conserved protein (DUF2088) [Haloquadratum walsbyi J07HQW2]
MSPNQASEVADQLSVPEEMIQKACDDPALPELGIIEQIWSTNSIPSAETAEAAAKAVDSLPLETVPAGGEIALGVGSRGIANLASLVSGVVTHLQDSGYNPFIFPAMGSHGGATGDGQQKKLAELNITEATIGCEIRSSMNVVEVGQTADREIPVVADANAASADAIIPINRVKPHTDFDGTVESGLSKMLVIGMGKQRGAQIAHQWAVDWSLRNMIPEITEQLLAKLPVVGGIAIVEDQHDETTLVEGVPPSGFLDREAELLEVAYDVMPKIPFNEIDIVVLDRQGKEISGQGLDTNVIGRRPFAINEPEPNQPNIKRIYVRGLTETTHGNAMGMGSADIVHKDVPADLETTPTLINALTASTIRGVKLPPVVETDRAGLIAALSTIGVVDLDTVRMLRATDTMHLHRFYASPALITEARDRADLRVIEEPSPIAFDNGQFTAPSLED